MSDSLRLARRNIASEAPPWQHADKRLNVCLGQRVYHDRESVTGGGTFSLGRSNVASLVRDSSEHGVRPRQHRSTVKLLSETPSF